jgi:hypothetical protein
MIPKIGHRFSDEIMLKQPQFLASPCRFWPRAAVDLGRAIGDFTQRAMKFGMGEMKRIVTAGLLAACACALLQIESAAAQTAAPGLRVAQLAPDYVPSRRKLRRVPIYPREHFDPDVYPRYDPGPNAVRECNAYYVQEARPSGTVITPRMNCFWRPG